MEILCFIKKVVKIIISAKYNVRFTDLVSISIEQSILNPCDNFCVINFHLEFLFWHKSLNINCSFDS